VGSSSPFTKGSPLYTTSVRVWWVGVGGGWVEYDRSDWLGTLLGPERTSRCGLFFLAVLAADHLTLTGARVCCGFVVWVVVVGVVGCGCLLSVA
jgi:hypothetical protein